MTLIELQQKLGERVECITDTSLTDEQRKSEAELSQVVCSLAKQMINNADIVLRADKLKADGKLKNSNITNFIDGKH